MNIYDACYYWLIDLVEKETVNTLNIVIFLFNKCFEVQFLLSPGVISKISWKGKKFTKWMYSLSPLVMIMTLFSKFQKFRENARNSLNKVIITNSDDNDFI